LLGDIQKAFFESFEKCLSDATKKDDLREVLEMLETECNFISANYEWDFNIDGVTSKVLQSLATTFNQLSAGHKVVLSIITY